MGSQHKSKSTRAQRGRSVISTPIRPQRPPRDGGQPLTFLAGDRETAAEAILQIARAAKPARQPSAEDPTLVSVLRDIRLRLSVIRSVAYTASVALKFCRAEADLDVAVTLQRCVGDELDRQLERLDDLLNRMGAHSATTDSGSTDSRNVIRASRGAR